MSFKRFSLLLLLCCVMSTSNAQDCMWEPDSCYEKGYISMSIVNTKDTREDGVSYERNRALLDSYLQSTAPGTTFETFLTSGPQYIMLDYLDEAAAEQTDVFLRFLIDKGTGIKSNWDINTRGQAGCVGNMTLLSEFIAHLPRISSFHWRLQHPMPPLIHSSLRTNHPTCHLYYDLNFGFGNFEQCFPSLNSASAANVQTTRNDRKPDYHQEFLRKQDIRRNNQRTATESILNSTILYSIKTHLDFASLPQTDLLHRIILSAPNLRQLDISTGVPDCDGSRPGLHAFDFDKRNVSFPPLEVLKLEGYRLGYTPDGVSDPKRVWVQDEVLKWPWNMMADPIIGYVGQQNIDRFGGVDRNYRILDPSELQLEGVETNLDRWLKLMDWSHLHTLSIENYPEIDFLPKLQGNVLPSLRNIRIVYADFDAVVEFFSNTVLGLESISLEAITFRNPYEHFARMFGPHTSTLKSLTITNQPRTEPEYGFTSTPRRSSFSFYSTTFINIAYLNEIIKAFPHLTTLEFDMQLSKTWDYELLDTIASIPTLKNLVLRFEPETLGHVLWSQSSYTEADKTGDERRRGVVRGLEAYLRKVKKRRPFESVRFWFGWMEISGEKRGMGEEREKWLNEKWIREESLEGDEMYVM